MEREVASEEGEEVITEEKAEAIIVVVGEKITSENQFFD